MRATEAVKGPTRRSQPGKGLRARPWGAALLGAAFFALITGAFAAWWAGPALVGGIVVIGLGERPEALLFTGSLLWALALTGLPMAGRPAPLLSTVLAFVGTRAYRGWARGRRASGGAAPDEGQSGRPAGSSPLVGWIAWLGGFGGSAVLLLTWLGRIQMFPALDASLASAQLGSAAGVTVALGGEGAGTGRRLVLLPLGLSLVSLSVLFWWFVLAP